MLNEVGRSIGLDAELRVGLSMNGKVVDSIVAGAVEAVIGAVYERSGYDGASVLVKELLLTDALVARAREHQDPISELKELVEARRWTPPKTMEFNSLIGERRLFYHSIELNGHAVMGMGSSKKKAKAQASRIMLLLLGPA